MDGKDWFLIKPVDYNDRLTSSKNIFYGSDATDIGIEIGQRLYGMSKRIGRKPRRIDSQGRIEGDFCLKYKVYSAQKNVHDELPDEWTDTGGYIYISCEDFVLSKSILEIKYAENGNLSARIEFHYNLDMAYAKAQSAKYLNRFTTEPFEYKVPFKLGSYSGMTYTNQTFYKLELANDDIFYRRYYNSDDSITYEPCRRTVTYATGPDSNDWFPIGTVSNAVFDELDFCTTNYFNGYNPNSKNYEYLYAPDWYCSEYGGIVYYSWLDYDAKTLYENKYDKAPMRNTTTRPLSISFEVHSFGIPSESYGTNATRWHEKFGERDGLIVDDKLSNAYKRFYDSKNGLTILKERYNPSGSYYNYVNVYGHLDKLLVTDIRGRNEYGDGYK